MKTTKVVSGLFILLILSLQSCLSEDEQVECLNKLLKDNSDQELVATLRDSIYSWSERELKGMSRFDQNESTWKIDVLLKNSSSDKLFGWVLEIDNDMSKNALDYVNYFSGEKRKGEWYFYLHNMPSIWADRENNGNKKYTFEQLSSIAKKEVIKGGLLKGGCEIVNSYISNWVDREDRKLYEWHQEFLKSGSQ